MTAQTIAFGPFRLLPAQQLLLEDEAPVRLGSRALEILAALVERAGEVVGKNELMARVWPNTFIEENTLRVHVAGLRRALKDGQQGRRFLAAVPGRGYRFVAPVSLSKPQSPSLPHAKLGVSANNLPLLNSSVLGRARVINSLGDQLSREGFVTIVGAPGVGKTTVALAVAEALLPGYENGVRFVDLAPIDDPRYVPCALAASLGLTVHPNDAMGGGLLDSVKGKRMLIVLDSCEHVIEAAASLAEQLLVGSPGVNILATSREPLRASGERVHRLPPLDIPANRPELTVTEALTSSAVQLFFERAAAISGGFELSDFDATVVSDICRKLGGNALAIELAAARVEAFGIPQLAVLLDKQFQILNLGKRTAQPRHQSFAAALDWSYDFLPEIERVILCRLSVLAGAFTLDAARAAIGECAVDVVDGIANLVSKSLLSADFSETGVMYCLLDTTRTYLRRKLVESGLAPVPEVGPPLPAGTKEFCIHAANDRHMAGPVWTTNAAGVANGGSTGRFARETS
jgi:predicted ATPase